MTPLERSAARLLCVGFHGDDAATVETEALAALGPGGLIVFARNVTTPERTRALVRRVASAVEASAGVRPFAGVDQEGGRVARFRDGAAGVPSMMAIGATGSAEHAFAAGRALATDVRRIGCDVDFAPVLDLALYPESRVTGTRSLGDDAERAGVLGAALARGLADYGVAAVAKHAPGHGDTGVDSHDAVPVLAAGPAALAARDLVPFRAAIAAGVPGVMLAHAIVPDCGDRPATFDPLAIALVRASLGAGVALFSDCLQMEAIVKTAGTAEAAALAIAAGLDIAIVSHDIAVARAAAATIARDVETGTITRERFAAALASADRFREAARALDARAGDLDARAREGEAAAAAIARDALTWLRGPDTGGGRAPLSDGEAVTIVSFEGALGASAERQGLAPAPDAARPSLALALRRLRVRAELFRVPLAPGDDDLEALELVLSGQADRRVVVVARAVRHVPAQARAIAAILARHPHADVICAGEPFDLAALGEAPRVLCTYGDGPAEMDALAAVLTGRAEAPGRVPVRLAATRTIA